MTMAKPGDTVRIHYTGRLTDGSEFDSSNGRDPLEFTLGAGQIIPGLEREIAGMAVGERKTVTAIATEAYGAHQPEGVQVVPRENFPADMDVAVGLHLEAVTHDGRSVNLVVTAVDETAVTVDANHPLAGKDLVFEVELMEIV